MRYRMRYTVEESERGKSSLAVLAAYIYLIDDQNSDKQRLGFFQRY